MKGLPIPPSPFRNMDDKKLRTKCYKLAVKLLIAGHIEKNLEDTAKDIYDWCSKPYNTKQ